MKTENLQNGVESSVLAYPVNLRKDEKFILVTFPDIPEAITCGNDRAHALEMAKEALESAMDFYFEDQRPVPSPSQPKRGQPVVPLSASLSAKILLLNETLRQSEGLENQRSAASADSRKLPGTR
jgi:antitoxin HicB